ncbi:MAG: ankyrin repeat domain-containing protein [Lautropia sp.]|nr:ankyrin repeat domain-containing protein [Lautropia sp.]
MRHQKNRTLAFSIMLAGSVVLTACGSDGDGDAMKLAASTAAEMPSAQGVPVKPASASGSLANGEADVVMMNDKDRPDAVAPAIAEVRSDGAAIPVSPGHAPATVQTIVVTEAPAETSGDQVISIPPAAAQVAQDGVDRTAQMGVTEPRSDAPAGTDTISGMNIMQHSASPQNATPAGWNGFRFDRAELEDIANENKLARRVFYEVPSRGPDAAWFDAVKRGDTATVKRMMDAGQNIEAKDENELGQTALGWAAFIGYEDIVDLLIARGADLNATDRGDVYNTLKSAALGKNVRIVKKIHDLLRDSTDLNDQSRESDGETLLMVAASNNRLEIAEYLIAQGANLNLVTTTQDRSVGAYDQSPLSYACTRNHPDMQALLIRHGAINHRTGRSGC